MANAHAEGNKLLTWKEIVDEIMGKWVPFLDQWALSSDNAGANNI